MNTPKSLSLIRAAFFLLTPLPLLLAQDATEDTTIQLDAFTVSSAADKGYQASQSISGSRFVVSIENAPYSIEVIPSALLKDTATISLQDSVAYATGTLGFESESSSDTTIYQRGFSTTLHLRDGIRKAGGFDAIGAERIEVINGPSSVLFGITNPGGTVNYITKQPVAAPLAEVAETVGSYGTSRTTVDIGGPLGSAGVVTYRMPTSFTVSDGALVNNASQKFYTDPVVAWQVTHDTEIEVSVEFQKVHEQPSGEMPGITNGPPEFFFTFLPRNWSQSTPMDHIDFETILPTLVLKHTFGKAWELRSTNSMYHELTDALYQARGGTQIPTYLIPRQSALSDISSENFQSNTDLLGNFEFLRSKLTSIFGIEFQNDFNKTHTWSGLGPGGTAPPSWNLLDPRTWNYGDGEAAYLGMTRSADNTTEFTSVAPSALVQFSTLNDRLFISGGVRHDWTKTVFTDYFAGTAPQDFTPGATTLQVGVLYHVAPALSVYANYSSSFQPLTQPLVNAAQQSFNPVPITGSGYEAGFKYSMLGGRVVQSIALYRIEQQNLVERSLVSSTSSQALFAQTQGGLQRSQGIEYNLNLALNDNWSLMGGYSYDDAHVIQDTPLANDVGQRLAFAYRYKVNVDAKYTFTSGPLRNLFVGAGYVDVGDAPAQQGTLNLLTYPSFVLVNPFVGYKWTMGRTHWVAQLNINNAFDRDYINYNQYRADPRNIDFTVRVRF